MWSILFKVILFIFIVISPILISMLVHFLYFYFVKNMRFKEGDYQYVGYGSILKRIVIDFPRQFVLDAFNRDPDNFREYGVHIIAGKQGSGKSITLTYMLLRYQQMYPKLKIKTNYYYEFENAHIGHWKDVVNGTNGIYGEIDVLDEIQNWFNSLQSKDFPVEMLTEITQQRKQTKMIIGTSQVFSRIAKPIREQTYMLYEPSTLFGCITFVRKYDITTDTSGQTDTKKLRGCFFFVHNEKLRNSYDTYRKIIDLSNEGFKSENEQIRNLDDNIIMQQTKKGFKLK